MLIHKDIASSYINKYKREMGKEDKDLLYAILTNPDTQLSGDFFETYNSREASRLVNAELSHGDNIVVEQKLKKLLDLPADRDTKSILHMRYGTYKCQFANMDDIWHLVKDFPDSGLNISETRPVNYYDSLQLRDEQLLARSVDPTDEGFDILLNKRDKYVLFRKVFFELIIGLRRTIGVSPFIAIVKRGILEDNIDNALMTLLEGLNQHETLLNNSMSIQDLTHYINRIAAYQRHNQHNKLHQETEKFGARRMSLILDVIYRKNQLRLQHKVVRKYFDNDKIPNMIIKFYENNYNDKWEAIKSLARDLQEQETFLRGFLNGKIPMK